MKLPMFARPQADKQALRLPRLPRETVHGPWNSQSVDLTIRNWDWTNAKWGEQPAIWIWRPWIIHYRVFVESYQNCYGPTLGTNQNSSNVGWGFPGLTSETSMDGWNPWVDWFAGQIEVLWRLQTSGIIGQSQGCRVDPSTSLPAIPTRWSHVHLQRLMTRALAGCLPASVQSPARDFQVWSSFETSPPSSKGGSHPKIRLAN